MKKHKILDHPILGGILLTVLFFGLTQLSVVGAVVAAIMHLDKMGIIVTQSICSIVLALLSWGIYRLCFRKEFKDLTNAQALKKGIILLTIPTLIFAGINIFGVFQEGFGNPFIALITGVAPGILEEIVFRGFFLSNAMRTCKTHKAIVLVLVVSALVFGGVHALNIIEGAGVGSTITQVIYAFGLGMMFGAVYLRTGSLLPSIIAHSIIDITGLLSISAQATGGVLTADVISWPLIVIGIVFAVAGLFYVRKSKTEEILKAWENKWVPAPEKEFVKKPQLQVA